MTKDEALQMCLEYIETDAHERKYVRHAIKEALAQPERDYERGFVDGMQKQMQSSVSKAVNAMSKRTWVGLTDDEIEHVRNDQPWWAIRAIEDKLKEKNT